MVSFFGPTTHFIKYQSETEKELIKWPNASDPLKQIDSKTKAALVRTYNDLMPFKEKKNGKRRRKPLLKETKMKILKMSNGKNEF